MVVDWLCPGLRPSGSRRPRLLHCKVILLDEHELLQDVLSSNLGQELLDRVFRHLNLLETAYFGLRYLDHENQTQWLDPSKKIGKQLKPKKGDLNPDAHTLYFCVKFYAADPCKLIEEITRYQFFLQVKQDILQGRLPVSFDLAAELGAYVVQSELGDYDPRRHSYGYVSEFRFLANQTSELEARIVELHKTLVGQLPSAAELNYLDKVKWLEMYGVDLHPVLGEDCVEYFLGLTPSGIILLRNKTKVGNYYWPRINKIYHKGKYFMLRVSEKNSADRTHGFETPSRGACRHLFRCCIDHQAFFRLMATGPPPLSPYSRFRSYSPPLGQHGQGSAITEKQQQSSSVRRMVQPSFQRMPSRRAQRRVVEGQEMVAGFVEGTTTVGQVQGSIVQSSNCLAHGGGGSVASRNNPSPRSTRSAPWTQSQPRGLYTSSSPRSVRSCGTAPALLNRLNRRSSSVESQSSADSHSRGHRRRSHSRSHRKHNRHSDCESQLSRGSTQKSGHRKHRRRHRSSRHSSRHEMVDSAPQWREAQRRKGEIIQRAVISTTEPRRKHRSKHRSPSSKHPLPDELRKHLEFSLVDTSGMSEQQRREIAYTVVQSQLAHHRQQQQLHHQQQQQQQQQHQMQQQHQQHNHNHSHHYQQLPPQYQQQNQQNHQHQQHLLQQNQQQQQQQPQQQQQQQMSHGMSPYCTGPASQNLLHAASNSRLDETVDSASSAARAVGFSVKRDRRTVYQCQESTASSFAVLSRASSRVEPICGAGSRHELHYSSRKESSSSSSLGLARGGSVCRLPIASSTSAAADSGLGESTTQDFSSCCSSSADSTKLTRATQRQLDEDGYYKLPSDTSKQNYPHGDATLDAVLQPIISTLTRRRRTRPK